MRRFFYGQSMTVDIATLAIRIDSSEAKVASQNLTQMQQAGGRAEQSTAGLEAAARKLNDVLKLLGAAIGANELIKQADLWASLEGRLRLVTNTERQMIAVRQQLYDMSQRTRGELEGTVDLYTKLTRSTQTLGTTEAQRLRVTESINKMMVISSATSEEAAGAIRQLGQAMGSGVLRGDELNRILESAPRLAEAIAAGMGRSTDEVRAMGAAGEITSKALVDSLLTQSQTIDDEFGKMPKVVGQAMVQIQNSFLRTVGVFDQTNQLSANLADTLSLVAENMGVLAAGAAGLAATGGLHWVGAMVVALRTKIAITTAAIVADRAAAATAVAAAATRVTETGATVAATTARLAEVRAATLAATGNVQLALTTNALIPAQVRATAAATAHAAALAAQAAAGAGAAGVAGWGARALGMLGGPVGIITTLLGLGATAWMMWGQKADSGAKQAKASLADATKDIIAELDKQIAKVNERNRLMAFAPKLAKTESPAAEQMRTLTAEINRIEKSTSLSGNEKIRQANELARQYSVLAEKSKIAAEGQAQLDTALKGDKRAKWLLDNSQYMNDAQKLAAAIAKAKTELGDAFTQADEAMIRAQFDSKNIEKAGKAYEDATKEAREYITSLQAEQVALGATESQMRMLAAARAAQAVPDGHTTKQKAAAAELRMQIMQEALALDQATGAWQGKTAAQERDAAAKKLLDDGVEAIWNQVRALQAEAEGYGKTAEAMVQASIKKVQAQLMSAELSEDETRALEMQLAGLRALSAEQAKLTALKGVTEEPQKLLDVMEALEDAAKSAGAGMADAFGKVGSAIGELVGALASYERTQAAISVQLAADTKAAAGDEAKLANAKQSAALQSTQAQLKSYGDMAKAGKAFFKENTAAYRAIQGVEKAYRAAEIAMAIDNMVVKSGLIAGYTGLFVASKAAETAATVASVGPDIAASMAKGQVAAAVGVASQAQGDPYSAWARMAAMAAVMAGLGFMVSGGGSKGDTTAKDRQAAAGTGSVFGDFADKDGKYSAKSESIARSIELSAANSSIELNYTQGMLRALLNIQNSMGNLGNLLIRGSGVTGAVPDDQLGGAAKFTSSSLGQLVLGGPFAAALDKLVGGWIGKTTGKIANSIFGGKVTSLDTGILASKTTVGGAMAGGISASQYIDTKKDGGWFHSDKYNTQLNSLGAEADAQFSKIIGSMAEGIGEAGKLLGLGGYAFTQRLNSFVVDIGKISTKGLTGEEIQKQLETTFSKIGDDMARYAVGGLAPFQKVGEGYLETLVRIGANYANLDAVLQSVGMTFGATGMSSIAAREELLALAGGIDELAGKSSSFAEAYLTEAERLAPVSKYVAEQMAKLGLASIDTREEFKKQVLGLNLSTDAGRKQYASLMDLADAFAKTHAATVDLTKSQQAIADERADLQSQLDELTMSSIQLLNKQRMALNASNRGLFDQIQAAKAAKAAQDAAKSSMGDMIGTLKSFGDSARALSASLVTGSLSTLTPEQQYAELERQYQTTRMAGIGGDAKARADYNSIATAYLTASQKINGGDARYSSDRDGVLRDAEEIAKWTTAQVDVAQASLDALNAQVVGIGTLNDSVLLLVAQGSGAMPSAIATPDYSRMGTSDKDALVAEVKALRTELVAEIKGRRADAQRQAGDGITSNELISSRSGKAIVTGVASAFMKGRISKVDVNDF